MAGSAATALATARGMLARARWAARTFAHYDRETVDRIVQMVARTAADRAPEYAEWAVRETGLGMARDKTRKNLAASRGLVDAYRGYDFVSPRVEPDRPGLALPRPAGVLLGLTPATSPVSTLYRTALLALLTRNAVVFSPHPAAAGVSAAAARTLAAAATAAGAPDGAIQLVEPSSSELAAALMADERTDLIVATGGGELARTARRSGPPVVGGAPGGAVPVLVDAGADVEAASRRIVESAGFDHALPGCAESVLIVETAVADRLLERLRAAGACPLDAAETDRLRAAVFPGGRFDPRFTGRDARFVAAAAGIPTGPGTRLLLAEFDLVGDEEPLAHPAPCPVLGFARAASAERGIRMAAALLRIAGGGPAAAVHSTDRATVLGYAAALPVPRVAVNAGTAPAGPAGSSPVPGDLVGWTRIGDDPDPWTPLHRDTGPGPWAAPAPGPVPPYPHASNLPAALRLSSPDPVE